MSDLIDMVRDADDADLLTALAARGARTITLKGGKVRVSVTLAMEPPIEPKIVPRRRRERTLVIHTDPRIRL
jgi:hypothetical protein